MSRKFYWLVALAAGVAILAGSLVSTWAGARKERRQEQEREVTLKQVPPRVKATILREAGGNEIQEIEEVTRGDDRFYEAAWIKDGKEVEIKVAANGKLLGKETEEKEKEEDGDDRDEDEDRDEPAEMERSVTQAEVPAAALATLKKMAAGAKMTAFAEEVEHGHTFYEGSWKNAAQKNVDVLVTPTGDLVEIEERVGADQVPAAVLKVARKAAGKGAELGLEKKTMILYEVKFRKGRSRHEVLLTPDGRRVEEEVEKGKRGEEDEDDDGDEEDDDGDDEDEDDDGDEEDDDGDDEDEDDDDEDEDEEEDEEDDD
ncbi:MAG: PepSY-like domain-containing protein [Planctomycetota bacterium]